MVQPPNDFVALYALASTLTKQDDTTKEAILEQVQAKTEAKGAPLTEQEKVDPGQLFKLFRLIYESIFGDVRLSSYGAAL